MDEEEAPVVVASAAVKQEVEMKEGTEAGSNITNSIKPMERRKARKALDKKRRRSATENIESKPEHKNMASHFDVTPGTMLQMGVFNDLASTDAFVRESAAKALLEELYEDQNSYDDPEKKVVNQGLQLEAKKYDGLIDCAVSVRYAVGRLIRGVSSSRECARQGFALGLTILVANFPSVKVESLMKLIMDWLEVSTSMKGQEVRDCLLGRLFAYGALARSGRLTQEWYFCKSTPLIKELISNLISLAVKKRYLQEPSVSIILELVEQLPVEALVSHVVESPVLQDWFKVARKAGNPDALLLALKLREKVSLDLDFGGLLTCPFSPSKFFTQDHLSSISECLKESTFCQPRVHSLWNVLLEILLPDSILQEDTSFGSNPKKRRKKCSNSIFSDDECVKSFHCFFEVVIEGSLLLSSHDRKHLVFDVLLLLLPRIPASFVPIVLSYKIVQCLMDILSTKDSWLYKVGEYFLKGLSDWVSEDVARRVSVIVAIQKHSNGKFDSITRTKTIRNLMAEFKTESDCMLLISNLACLFVGEAYVSDEPSDQSQTTDENSEIGSGEDIEAVGPSENVDFLKSWIIESLSHALKYLKLDSESNFRVQKEILKFLAVQGLFTVSLGSELTSFELQDKFRWPKAPTSRSLCEMCISQLQSLLANAQKAEKPFATANRLEANDLGSYFVDFLVKLRSIPSVSLFRPLCDEDEKALEKLQEMENKLSREERNSPLRPDAGKLHTLRYLLIQLILQLLLRPLEFSETALELIICCEKAFDLSVLLGDEPLELDSDEIPALMDVLVDTLLSLLPQSSAPLRFAIEQVFRYFCDDVTDDGLLRMLRVIRRDLKPARHVEVESGDGGDDNDDDDLVDIEEAEESEAEGGEMAESDEQSEVLEGAKATVEDLPEGSNDSDEGMDDDEMFKMDSYLARIFKERKNHGSSETAQSQLFLFKLRVLSLLEIYLHENPGRPQVLTIYSHLAQAFVSPHMEEGSEQLEQRMWGILQKKIFKAKEYPKGVAVQPSTLKSLLERNLRLASKPFKRKKSGNHPSNNKQSASWNKHKLVLSLARDSIFWLLKIIDARSFEPSELEDMCVIFADAIADFFNAKKSQLKCDFLKEIFRRRPWVGRRLFGELVDGCGDARFEFRQVEALDVIAEVLKGFDREGLKKRNLGKLCGLIRKVGGKMPGKQSRRRDVRKFCGRVLKAVSSLKLTEAFLKRLDVEGEAALESQLGGVFLEFKKQKR